MGQYLVVDGGDAFVRFICHWLLLMIQFRGMRAHPRRWPQALIALKCERRRAALSRTRLPGQDSEWRRRSPSTRSGTGTARSEEMSSERPTVPAIRESQRRGLRLGSIPGSRPLSAPAYPIASDMPE